MNLLSSLLLLATLTVTELAECQSQPKAIAIGYEEWLSKWKQQIPQSNVFHAEGLFALYMPKEKTVKNYLALMYAKQSPASMRLLLLSSDEKISLIYKNQKLYFQEFGDSVQNELTVAPLTLNDLILQWIQFLMGDSRHHTLVAKDKFSWKYKFENAESQWLEAYPQNKNLKISSVKIRLNSDGKMNLIQAMDGENNLGFVFEIFKTNYLLPNYDFSSKDFQYTIGDQEKKFLEYLTSK